MKKVFLIILWFTTIAAKAQKKGSWQVFIEPSAMKVNNTRSDVMNSNYRLLDSAGGVFKKYNNKLTEEITSKVTVGIAAGFRYNYSLTKTITLYAGINISRCQSERSISINYETLDSSTITLAGSGPTWIDPSNGHIIRWINLSQGQFLGYAVNPSGVLIANFGYPRPPFRHFAEGTEKMTVTLLEIPVGATFTPQNSRFSFCAEISPAFLIRSAVLVNYDKSNEISTPQTPAYSFYASQWRVAAGVNYRISNSVEAGLFYKHYLRSLISEDNIRFRSLGLKICHTFNLWKL